MGAVLDSCKIIVACTNANRNAFFNRNRYAFFPLFLLLFISIRGWVWFDFFFFVLFHERTHAFAAAFCSSASSSFMCAMCCANLLIFEFIIRAKQIASSILFVISVAHKFRFAVAHCCCVCALCRCTCVLLLKRRAKIICSFSFVPPFAFANAIKN